MPIDTVLKQVMQARVRFIERVTGFIVFEDSESDTHEFTHCRAVDGFTVFSIGCQTLSS